MASSDAAQSLRHGRFGDEWRGLLPMAPNPGAARTADVRVSSQRVVSQEGQASVEQVVTSNGTWTWFNDPRAVYDAATDTLFYGVIRDGGVVSFHSANLTTGTTQQGTPRTLVFQDDDHANPALCLLASGKILGAYSQRIGDSFSARTANTLDIRTWEAPVALASGTVNDAYAQLHQMGDTDETVYWIFRRFETGAPPNERTIKIRTSTNDGSTWGDAFNLLFESGNLPYVITAKNGANRIDFVVTNGHPSDAGVVGSVYHFYLVVASDGSREYFRSDGTSIGDDTVLPLSISDLTQVYNGSTNEAWIWDIAIIGGSPVIALNTFESGDTVHKYLQARWNGSAWQVDEIASGGTTATADYLYAPETKYSAGIALDPNNVNVVFLSREYGARNFRLEKWAHTGTWPSGTWAKAADISGNTGSVNARPYSPRGLSPTRVLWWEGTYNSYADFSTRVRLHPAVHQ